MTPPIQRSVRKAIDKPLETVAVRAYLSANQENLTGDAWNKVALNTVDYDNGGNFDTVNNRFETPVTGLYSIHGVVTLLDASVIVDKKYASAIYKNGSLVKLGNAHASLASSSISIPVFLEAYLEKDDYIELYCFPNVGGGVNTVDIYGGSTATDLIIRLVTKEGIRQ